MTSTPQTSSIAQADARFAELGEDLSIIPKGCYCYTPQAGADPLQNGRMPIVSCPFWASNPDAEEQMNGYCALIGAGDWEEGGTMLLWDMVKECGLNDEMEIEDGPISESVEIV
jgi:hypothetical protein